MPELTTSKGGKFDVDYAWAPTPDGSCHIQMQDARRLYQIAEDFDGCQEITYHDPDAGVLVYAGYTAVSQITRYNNGKVTVRLRRED